MIPISRFLHFPLPLDSTLVPLPRSLLWDNWLLLTQIQHHSSERISLTTWTNQSLTTIFY